MCMEQCLGNLVFEVCVCVVGGLGIRCRVI